MLHARWENGWLWCWGQTALAVVWNPGFHAAVERVSSSHPPLIPFQQAWRQPWRWSGHWAPLLFDFTLPRALRKIGKRWGEYTIFLRREVFCWAAFRVSAILMLISWDKAWGHNVLVSNTTLYSLTLPASVGWQCHLNPDFSMTYFLFWFCVKKW